MGLLEWRKGNRGEEKGGEAARGGRRGKERGRRKKAETEEGRGAVYKEFMNTRLHLESPG